MPAIWEGEFDATCYTRILHRNLIPSARAFYPSGHWWLLQDNAPQHTSAATRDWLHNNGVDCLDFPPLSPDLNPIENLWADLKRRVEAHRPRTIAELEACIRLEWQATPLILLRSLAHSMPARLAAV